MKTRRGWNRALPNESASPERPGLETPEPQQPEPAATPWLGARLSAETRNYWFLVGLAFAVSIVFRTVFLRADPPWDFTWSQDLFTDGARVVDGARNRILFGQWITDPRSPAAVFYPLPSLIAWVIFKIGGLGLAQANVTSVIPAMASLALVFYVARRLEGNLAGLLALIMLGFSYLHVIYSRVPMVESLLILAVLAAFWLAMGGRRRLFLAGLIVGLASFLVKLHAIHFVPVVVLYLILFPREDSGPSAGRAHLILSFLGGFLTAFGIWLGAVYAQHSEILDKYFTSNVLLSQKEDYQGLTIIQMLERRVAGVIHVGSGRDGYLVKTAEIFVLAWISLLGMASRFAFRRPSVKRWELLSAIWFIVLIAGLGALGYRPLRYFALLTPSVCLLALSLLLRLERGEQVISSPRPRWFIYAFGFWLAWVVIHIQQEIVFQVMTGGRVVLVNEMNAFQKSLYRYQFMVFPQLAIFGGIATAFTLFFHHRISVGVPLMSLRRSRRLFVAALTVIVALGVLRFAIYAADRRYSVVEAGQSLTRVFSDGVFLAGDCSALVSLETDFKTLPSYGDMIRHKEKDLLEQYPITHFILRFPTLFEYLSENYPDFEETAEPVRIFSLCGREATIVRYDSWPGYQKSGYVPTDFETAVQLMHADDVNGARILFQRFLEQHPDSYEALWGVGLCAFRDGDVENAKVVTERALELTDRDALSLEAYADIMDALDNPVAAAEYYRKAIDLSPNSRRLARKYKAVREMIDG